MSNAENPVPNAEEIRASLGPSHLRYEGRSYCVQTGGGTIVEFSDWVNNETSKLEHSVRIPDPDDVRESVIIALRGMQQPGLSREQLAQELNKVGARLPDQTPVSFLVLPTRTTLEQDEHRWGGRLLPLANRDFDLSGIDAGYIHTYQMGFKPLTRTEQPLTVGEIRRSSLTVLRNSGARATGGNTRYNISEGSVKFAQAVLRRGS